MGGPKRIQSAVAAVLVVASAAVGAGSCGEDSQYLFIGEGTFTTSVDMSTWTAHITADLLVGANLRQEAQLGLDAVRIEERPEDGSDPMEFTVDVTLDPNDWPLNWLESEYRSVHIEATANVPEERRQMCISPTEVAFLLDVVTDYGATTSSTSMFTNQGCW